MQLISCTSNKFKVAAERTDGIPEHAIEIEGDLVNLDTKNLNDWGIQSSIADEIMSSGVGIPIRMCNSIETHECDFNEDHWSDVGYVTKLWKEDKWIKAKAAITDRVAGQKIDDGTWMRGDYGNWSISGYPGSELDKNNLLNKYLPASISFVLPPNKPAYEGSKFELVTAAVNEIKEKFEFENNKHSIKEEIMADEKEDIKPDDSKKTKEQDDTKDVKTEPKVEPKTEVNIQKGDEVTMYDQDALDKRIAGALEKQKIEYESQMANMTPTENLEPMLAAAKTETIKEIHDELKRDKLTDEYITMLTASTILKAPFMVDGKLDKAKLLEHGTDTKMLSAAVIETKIAHAKAMVAAMPAPSTAFDHADVLGNVQDNDFNEKMSKLGVTHVEFS